VWQDSTGRLPGRGSDLTDDPPASGISDAPTAGACPRCGVPGPPGAACPACGFDASAEASPSAALGQGDVAFPGFTVLRRVAAGGMGEVLQAHPDRHVGDLRAIKVVRPELVGNDRTERLFQDEVVAVQRIVHPGVVRVFHCGRATDGRMFVVMEWLPGRSLAAAIRDPASPFGDPAHPALPALAAALVRQLGAALDATHAEFVLHRDIKPSNVMLCREPGAGADAEESVDSALQAKLIDFGIARLGDGARTGQSASVALGTVEHMAPEVARGEATTVRTDVYLLAQLMYRVVTGLRRTTGAPRPPSRVNPRFPRELDDLFADALADEPRYRPAAAGELASAMAGLLGGIAPQEAEAERALKAEAEAEEKARRQAEAEEKARRQAEAEEKARRQAEAEEKARRQAEAEEKARRQAEAEEKARRQAEAEEKARRQAEADAAARRQAEADAAGRRQAEANQGAASEARSGPHDARGQRRRTARSGLVAALALGLVAALALGLVGLLALLVVAGTRGGEREESADAVASRSSTPAATPSPTPAPTPAPTPSPATSSAVTTPSPSPKVSEFTHAGSGIRMVRLPDGSALGKYEVTNAQYAAFLTARGGSNECGDGRCVHDTSKYLQLSRSGDRWTANSGYANHPVVMVTAYGADEFAKHYDLELPTETQWQYACEEGDRGRTWAGTDTEAELATYANLNGAADGHAGLAPVGKLKPNGWGLHDLSGNVWEWTSTPSGVFRVFRGGGFGSTPSYARCAFRSRNTPGFDWNFLGFRVALSPQR